jgi:hypothetical protein
MVELLPQAPPLPRRPEADEAVVLRVHGRCAPGQAEPVTVGLPFPKGSLTNPTCLALLDGEGRAVPIQATPLARWSDESVKWLLVDFLVDGPVEAGSAWSLTKGREAARPRGDGIRVERLPDAIAVDTGAATFQVGRGRQPLFRASVAGAEVMEPGSAQIVLIDDKGGRPAPTVDDLAVEFEGPLRTTIRAGGRFAGRAPLRFTARFCVFAGTGLVRVRVTLHNPRRARHAGGLWDLGDPGSVLFRELAFELGLAGAGGPEVIWTAEPGQTPRRSAGGALEIYQDSSGGENWNSRNHVNRRGQVPCSFRGYRVRGEDGEERGDRANPVVTACGVAGRITAAVPEFWQQFPKALEVRGRSLSAALFPGQFGDLFELQGGERKTHALWLDFGPPGEPPHSPLAWVHDPVRVTAAPEWYERSAVIPYFSPAPDGEGDRCDDLLRDVVDGPDRFAARRETIDEYGWRNFGEVYADHEGAYYHGAPPVVSHYNNQYDCLYGMIVQRARTGDERWFELLDPLARHVVDIDVYHTTRDRAAYNGGLFWHTDHYRDAATSTHRAYSRKNRPGPGRPYGGGPCNEHNYTTGLLHYYYLTGDETAREVVAGLAEWVIAMDDGARTVLGRLDDGPTGHASRTRDAEFHGPGRGCGNSVNALLDGWLATGRGAYLEKAEALIRRSVHPDDDVAKHELLATERRWSYTVFLSVLGRYLGVKAEAGALDGMYAYARASLLTYAGWMLENEVPYFDRPAELEYPTETWAAQELRKANVLRLAAAHADEPLRSRLGARGDELADRAWSDLSRFESRGVARSVALLLQEGVRDAYFRSNTIGRALRPAGVFEFGVPEAFVPQKARVVARLKTARGLVEAVLRLAGVSPSALRGRTQEEAS